MPEPNKPEPNVLPVQNKMEVTSMYYSSGNYEAFARPRKPEGVDRKSAYIIGSGLAALTVACYLVRDGQMKGERVHVFEKDPLPAMRRTRHAFSARQGMEMPAMQMQKPSARRCSGRRMRQHNRRRIGNA